MSTRRTALVRNHDLVADLDGLLGELCAEWGFCNSLSGAELVSNHAELTGDTFAIAVLVAERLDPRLEKAWRKKIARRFIERYGDPSRRILTRPGSKTEK